MHGLSTRCYVCQHEFLTPDGKLDKVRDHCHLTGRYLGAAHNKCNLAIRNPKFVPVVFHNLEGYDCHLFIKNLGLSEGEIRCKLDPAHYYTATGLAWDASLFKTGVKLDLLTDPDMYLMVERGIRGGISMITHRHSMANNKYMKDYNSDEESKYITYLDANNLYGYAMVQKLPTSDFRWMEPQELEDWTSMPVSLRLTLSIPPSFTISAASILLHLRDLYLVRWRSWSPT